jgi:phosphatidylglycerol:prolipoprotein diacylglycerol transferase
MYPYDVIFGIDLYTIFLCLGIVGAIVVFRLYSDRLKMNWKVQNFTIISAFGAIITGYFSAVVFQALYEIEERGGFIIDKSTGATFYGGLIGGAAFFLAIYFGIGHFVFKDNIHIKSFFNVADIAAASIAIAHAFGRIGCLMAGCCHGKIADVWYAVNMPGVSLESKVVPIQLYEALFLFAMFAFFTYRIFNKKSCNLPLYMAIYGAWRFVVEYFRTDDRGTTLVDFFTPSRLIALIMIVGSVALLFGQIKLQKHMNNTSENSDNDQ